MLNSNPDDKRYFPVDLAVELRSAEAAIIAVELSNYLAQEKVGVFIGGLKYIDNTMEFEDWIRVRCGWFSPRQIRKAINLLRKKGLIKVIRPRTKQLGQRNYYTLDEELIIEILEAYKHRPNFSET